VGGRSTGHPRGPARLARRARADRRRSAGPAAAELERALAVREGLRALAAGHNGARPDPGAVAGLRSAAAGLRAGIEVAADGTTAPVPASADVAGALGLVLAVVHERAADRTWARLKACPGDHCGWVFYDHSRNQAGSWCSMRVCGGREKARAYRRRSRGA
jgi:predicted RNA-binding Zn ribbon-like protein